MSLGPGKKSLERGSTFSSRGEPLSRSKGLERSGFESRSAPKRKRRRQAKTGYGRLVEGGCVWSGKGKGITCSSRIDPHHIIKQQTIKQRFPHGAVVFADGSRVPAERLMQGAVPGLTVIPLDLILRDRRNLIPVCRTHHEGFHASNFRVSADELPDAVREFAAEYGLLWALDRIYGPKETT